MSGRILVVDDDRAFRVSTAELLRQDGYEVMAVAGAREAVDALRAARFDLMLLDLRMPGLDGTGLVTAIREWGDGIPVLMISGFGTVDTAVHSLHAGADDFLTKPVEPAVLSDRVATLLERRPAARPDSERMNRLVGRSPAMKMVFEAVRLVAPTDATVLVLGETGTGKELLARSLHELSGRSSGPFVTVNCAALPEGLLESELFGHVRGSFTGAVRDRIGLFQAAHGGSIFLDEVGDISAAAQQRLLRVLQERELRPVGAIRAVKIDVRVIAATNRSLRAQVEAGRFREDLFYRLNVFRIELPALRERRSDIPLLVEHALDQLARRSGGAGRPICSPFALRMLQAYDWPGNVRELFAVLESACIRAGSSRIEAQHLTTEVRAALRGTRLEEPRYRSDDDNDAERAAILAALDQAGGIRSRAAALLGMGRTTLWRKMRQHGLVVRSDPDT